MQRKRQSSPCILALTALAITFSLAVRAQAQTVTAIASFDSQVALGPGTDPGHGWQLLRYSRGRRSRTRCDLPIDARRKAQLSV